jgi:hypothetical protein
MAANKDGPGVGGAGTWDGVPFGRRERPSSTAGCTGSKARAIKRTLTKVDRELDADRRFFERRPGRRFRVRRVYPNESKLAELCGFNSSPPAGAAMFVAIEQIAPGLRIRLAFCAPPDMETDLPDEAAGRIYCTLNIKIGMATLRGRP